MKGKLSSIWSWIAKHKIITGILLLALIASVTVGVVLLTNNQEDIPEESEPSKETVQKEVSIDFEDGKYGFVGVDKYVNADGDDFTLSLEEYNGSKALKCMTYGKNPYLAIQVDALMGDRLSKLKTIEVDVGIKNPDGTFYSASGCIYALLGEKLDKDSVTWSVFKEDGNPKTVIYTLPEGKKFTTGNYIVISMETDTGRDKGDLPADLYIDNIAFKDSDGNVLPADTSATYVKKELVEDRNHLWDLTDIVEFDGFKTSGDAWEQSGFMMPQKIIDALVPNSVVEIAFESETDNIWLVMPESVNGFMRAGCYYTNNGSSYYNDAKTIAQIPYEMLVKYCGADVSQWGTTMQCESAGKWSVHSVKVGQRVAGTGMDLYVLKDRVYVDGVEEMEPISEAYGVTGIWLSQAMLTKMKDNGAIEVRYQALTENALLWFAGHGTEDADEDGQKDWKMIGGPVGSDTEFEVRRDFENTIVQISYETLTEYYGEGWADDANGFWFMLQASGKCKVESIQIGKIGTGEDTWYDVAANAKPLYILKDRVFVDGVEDMEEITKEYGVTGINLSKKLLQKLKDGGAIEVTYEMSKAGTSAWFAGQGAVDKDGDGQKDWQMIGGLTGTAMEADVRRNAAGTVMQITYETLSEYLDKGWADSEDGYWFMIQASGPCKIKSIQIGKVGTGEDTWLNEPEQLVPLYILKNRIYVSGVESMSAISSAYGISGINLTSSLLSKLKDGGAVEVCYEPGSTGNMLWFAGNDTNGKWQMIGGPAGSETEDEVRRNAAGTIVQITYETLTKYLGEGWADTSSSYYFIVQGSGSCTIKSIQIGKVGTGEDTWAATEPEEETPVLYVLKDRVYVSGVENMEMITGAYSVSGITLNSDLLAKLKDGGAVEVKYVSGADDTILWFAGNGPEDADGDGQLDWQMIGGPVGHGTEEDVRRSEDGTIVQITYETLTKYYGEGWADSENGYYFMLQGSGNCRIESIQIGKIGEGEDTWATVEPENPEGPEEPEDPEDDTTADRTNLYTLTDSVAITEFTTSINSGFGNGNFSITKEIAEKLKAGAVIEIAYECAGESWMGTKTLWFAGHDANNTWQMIGYPGDGGVAQDELRWNADGTIVQVTYETLNAYLASNWNTEGSLVYYQSGGPCTIKSITIGVVPETADRTNLYTLTDTMTVTGFNASINSGFGNGNFSVTKEIAEKLKAGAVIEIAYECEGESWMGTKTLWFAGHDANNTWRMIGYPGDGGVAQDELRWNADGTIVQVTYETLNAYLASDWNTEGSSVYYQSGGPCTIQSITIGTRTPQ